MLAHEGCYVSMSAHDLSDADASRPRSGILTPTSDGSIQHHDVHQETTRCKRTPGDGHEAMAKLLEEPISVRPHPVDLHAQPRHLQPLILLPRKYFPLSCLDLCNPAGGLPRSRFFESRIKILDLEVRMGTTPSVVIARAESDGSMFALEHHSARLYTVCRLGSWVKLEDLAPQATAALWNEIKPTHNAMQPSAPQPDTDHLSRPVYREHRKKRAAIEAIQTLVRKRPRSISSMQDIDIKVEPSDLPVSTETPHNASAMSKSTVSAIGKGVEELGSYSAPEVCSQENPQQNAQHSLETIFEVLRTQYFEILYKSMGSLAYFAKGPLSRARTTFHLDLDASLDMSSLVDFLKTLLLTTVQIDKKYRETVPELCAKAYPMVNSSDEGQRSKRRAKKMKVGKDGLYPYEDKMVQSWWMTNKPEMKDGQSQASNPEIRAYASRLRTRETQLQMILILEIMALEPLKAPDDTLPGLPDVPSSKSAMAPPAPKKRNKHNLLVLLDVHADRLTIWQSTGIDDHLASADVRDPASDKTSHEQKPSSEPLKDFCTDVIIPFFSARLPQQCDAISRKLGGPTIVSPPKAKSSRHKTASKSQKPGAAARRQIPAKPERTLQRALSTDLQSRRSVSRGPTNAIALMRSASSTALMGMKREASETPTTADCERERPGSSSLSRRSSGGECKDPRAQKKALVDAELKDAISALRKPNRQVVGKAMAEAADFKASAAAQSAKKLKRTAKIPIMPAVQVHATPVNSRFKDVLAPRSENITDSAPRATTDDLTAPSSVDHNIPSTVQKTANSHSSLVEASPFCRALDVVGSSPVKTSARSNFLLRPASETLVSPSSPLCQRKVPSTPHRAVSQKTSGNQESGLSQCRDVRAPPKLATGSPRRPGRGVTTTVERAKDEGKTASIYQQLGWDDDFDDLL